MKKSKLSPRQQKLFSVESLEQRILLSADPIVTELAAQYHEANNQDLGVLEVTAPAIETENVQLNAQTIQAKTLQNALNLNLTTAQDFSLNTINVADFSQFQTENGIVIGDANSNAIINLGDTKTDDGKLVFNQNLLISNPQAGGEIFVDDDLIGGANADLTINGSGHTTILSANISTTNTNITVNDSLKISGVNITDQTLIIDSGASIQLGSSSNHFLDGDGVSGGDKLIMKAATTTGNIVVKGIVGGVDPLEALTITGKTAGTKVNNVTFESDVTVNGDVIIDALGTVTFNAALNVTGNLTINGASLIVFGNNVVVADGKNIFLEANEITLNGGQESVRGTGILTMRPTDPTYDIAIASPPSENTSNTLNLSSAEIFTLGTSFSNIIIGHLGNDTHTAATATSGTVYIGSKAANQNTFFNPVEIYGNKIEIKDFFNPDFKFQTKNNLKLDAISDITIYNETKAFDSATSLNKDVTLYSLNGKILQTANDGDALSRESIVAGTLTITAETGVDLGFVDASTISVTNDNLANDITINSTASTSVTTTFNTVSARTSGKITLSSDVNSLIITPALTTDSGNISIKAGVLTATGTTVSASTGALTLSSAITSTSGTITLESYGDLTLNGTISTAGSGLLSFKSTAGKIFQNVDITSTNGSAITLTAGDNIQMLDGKKTETTGTITLNAGNNVWLSILNSTTTINVTATAGAISDNLTGETANILGTTTTVSLTAKTGIGAAGTADINTTIANLSATNGATGGIFINETDALTISPSGVKQDGGTGSIVITNATDTAITVEGDVNNTGSGHVLINAQDILTINNQIKSAAGNISLLSATNLITFGANGGIESTGTTSSIDVEAALAITMTSGSTIKGGGGNIRLNAKSGDLKITSIDAKTGKTSLLTTNSQRILDNDSSDDLDITSGDLRIFTQTFGESNNPIEINATNLSVSTVSNMFMTETDGVIVKTIDAITAKRVGTDGATLTDQTDAAQSDLITSSNGAIVLTSIAGDIVIQDGNANSKGVEANGSGNILLNAVAGNLKVEAPIKTTSGHINLLSGATISQTAEGDVSTASGTIDVVAATAITMADGAETKTTNQDIRYKTTTGDITVGLISTFDTTDANGDVAILAGGKIIDVDLSTNIAADIIAKTLYLTAGTGSGIGAGDNPLETTAQSLAAKADAGGMFIVESDALIVDTVATNVMRISTDGSTLTAQSEGGSDLITTGNGAIFLKGLDLIFKEGSANNSVINTQGTGNILLQATAGNISFESSLTSTAGNISFNAAQNILLSSVTQISTGNNSMSATTPANNPTIDMLAGNNITMVNGSRVTASNANIRLAATQGDISLGMVNAGTGNVSLSGKKILDFNDTGIDISAVGLRIVATENMGLGNNPFETTVTTLSAKISGNGGLFINETDSITVGLIDTMSVNRVSANANVTPLTDEAQSDILSTANGSIVLTSVAGSITVLDGNDDGKGVISSLEGNILLKSSEMINLEADVLGNKTNISLLAVGRIVQSSEADVITGSGTIDYNAGTTIQMTDGARIQTVNQNIRLSAVENVTFSGVNAGQGSVSILGNTLLDAGDTELDVIAKNLRINTKVGAGISTNALDINVENLTATATTGGLFITEKDNVSVTEVPNLAVNRVDITGNFTNGLSDAQQSNLTSTTGAIVLLSQIGDITILEGNLDGKGIATETGNILINAFGNLTIQSAIETQGANIQLLSGATLSQTGTGSLIASGTIDVNAATDIVMAENTLVRTLNSDIRYKTDTGNITLGSLNAGTGNVTIIAGESIFDAGKTALNIIATGVNLTATNSVGTGADNLNPLEINVAKLSARTGAGGVFISNAENLLIDSVNVTVKKIDTAGVATLDETLITSDVTAFDNGAIVLNAKQITIKEGENANEKGILASGTGNILLSATQGNLELQAGISSSGGNISLQASGVIQQFMQGEIATINNGTIDLNASVAILMASQTKTLAGSGNIRLSTNGALTISQLSTEGNVSLIADKIGLLATETDNVSANGLRLFAMTNVGEKEAMLKTNINQLSANVSNGDLFIIETDGITITETPEIKINRVSANGAVENISDVKQSDVNVKKGVAVLTTLAGDIVVLDGDKNGKGLVTNAGNVLLNSAQNISTEAEIMVEGDLTLVAGKDILQGRAGHLTVSQTLYAQASGAITMSDGAKSKTANQDIYYQAVGDVALAELDAGNASIAVISSGAISDASSAATNFNAMGLLLTAEKGIAGQDNPLEMKIQTLTAKTTEGGIFLSEVDTVVIDNASVSVQRVDLTGSSIKQDTISQNNIVASTDELLSGVVSISAGKAILDTNSDKISITAHGLSLNAQSVGISTNVLNTAVANLSGLISAGNLFLDNEKTLTISQVASLNGLENRNGAIILSTKGDLTVQNNLKSVAGNILLSTDDSIILNSEVSTTDSNLSILAGNLIQQNAGGNIVTTGKGTIDVSGEKGILMTDAKTTTQNQAIRYLSNGDISLATLDAGKATIAIATQKSILQSNFITAVGLNLSARNSIGSGEKALKTNVQTLTASAGKEGMFITQSNDLAINEVSVTVQRVVKSGNDLAQKTISDTGLKTSFSGSIVLSAGNLTVDSQIAVNGAGLLRLNALKNLQINAPLKLTSGKSSLFAGENLTQTTKGAITTRGSLDLDAPQIMIGNAPIRSSGADIHLHAAKELSITNVNAGRGDVTISAAKLTDGGDKTTDVIATNLRLTSGAMTAANALEIDAKNLSAEISSGDLFIFDVNNLTLAALPAVSVARVDLNGALTNLDYEKFDGVAMDKGNLSIATKRTLTVADSVKIISAGNVDLFASNNLNMKSNASIVTQGEVLRLQGRVLTVSNVQAPKGSVSLVATSIVKASTENITISADKLRLQASKNAGTARSPLIINANLFSVKVGSSGLFVSEQDALTVGKIDALAITRASNLEKLVRVTDTTQADLNSSGAIVLVAQDDIILTDGNNDKRTIVQTRGNLLLESKTGKIETQAIIRSAGSVSLHAKNLEFTDAGQMTLSNSGTLELEASENLTMAKNTIFTTKSGNLRLSAEKTLTIGDLTSNSGSVSLLANTIIDGNENDTNLNVKNARIQAQQVGSANNELEINAGVLSSVIGDSGFFVTVSKRITLGETPAQTVNQVLENGSTQKITDALQSGLTSTDSGKIYLSAIDNVSVDSPVTSKRGDIFIESKKGSILQEAAISSTGKIQLLVAGKVFTNRTQLAQIVDSFAPIASYNNVNNEPFYLWQEKITL